MVGSKTKFLSDIASRRPRTELSDIDADRESQDSLGIQAVTLDEGASRQLTAGDDHPIEEIAIEHARREILVERGGDMSGFDDIWPPLHQIRRNRSDPTIGGAIDVKDVRPMVAQQPPEGEGRQGQSATPH